MLAIDFDGRASRQRKISIFMSANFLKQFFSFLVWGGGLNDYYY